VKGSALGRVDSMLLILLYNHAGLVSGYLLFELSLNNIPSHHTARELHEHNYSSHNKLHVVNLQAPNH